MLRGACYVVLVLLLTVGGLWAASRPVTGTEHPDTPLFTDRHAGVPLVDGFVSFSGLDAVNAQLSARRINQRTLRTLARAPDLRYPPRSIDTLTLEHYPLLATQGRLSLQFFNDRLFEVDYKPDDVAASVQGLKRTNPGLRRDANGRAEQISGALRIAGNLELAASSVGRSLNTEPYVLWQDLRLVRERDDWDARFGGIPDRAD